MSDVVRWGAFSCALVPLVLIVSGASWIGAAGTAAGLAAVTCACRALLRQSERTAARIRVRDAGRHRDRSGRSGPTAHGGGRHSERRTPVD
ncbi:hypothetical protein DY245_09145 [Streptomyces inhibens]|uniref:Uncharacterized protein n=1 Tax=Streptomyces inhibens TaxID=2293571 RepID=A0A371Q850_STRIH|nr:hypothetical protein [Streptomyces inhibens]REK90633.1 hypothetical protein DY245_09145 [Streptomyces inhibens]UKY50397.1 hypothetical protein KI385_17245 [Streptomyces inhibens]